MEQTKSTDPALQSQAENIKALMTKTKQSLGIREVNFDELFFDLTGQADIDNVFEWQGLAIELMKVLTNPAVSQGMDEYYHDRAGEMLKRLYFFFWSLDREHEATSFYLDALKVKFWANESVNLEEIETYYSDLLKTHEKP